MARDYFSAFFRKNPIRTFEFIRRLMKYSAKLANYPGNNKKQKYRPVIGKTLQKIAFLHK